jgi:tRNA G46 methylase TrmB
VSDWTPPELLPSEGRRVKGALSGSLLFEQPEHKAEAEAMLAFLAGGGPVAIEVGVDHGTVLIDHARRYPNWRWLGMEIRKRKVEKARPHAPENARLWAADARSVFAAVLADRSVDRVDILFPTPVTHPRHLLLTDAFVSDLARVVRPTGVVTVATDVEGLFQWACERFASWRHALAPERGPVRSRRERVCQRDGLPVSWGHWHPPEVP